MKNFDYVIGEANNIMQTSGIKSLEAWLFTPDEETKKSPATIIVGELEEVFN